ncbi:hypothetical protein Tco_0079465 [Tanacetum coccineum]
MSIYLKHMGGYKHNQLKGRSYDEIQKLFDKEMKRVNSFVAMNSEAREISRNKDESSSKKAEIAQDSSAMRAGDKLESDKSKKQKTDENEEVEVDNKAELKKHMVTVKDDDIAIDAIPLAIKPLGIDREDLQTHWKLVKTKHGDTWPEDEYERVLWGDLKVMFEPNIKSDVWRNLQGYKVTVWKLFDSCGVHFVRTAGTKVYAAGLQLLEELLLFVRVLIADFSASGTVNLPLKMKRDMIIKNLDLKPTIDAMMRDILYSSQWKELSKETSSKILPCGDGSFWKTYKLVASLIAKGKLK